MPMSQLGQAVTSKTTQEKLGGGTPQWWTNDQKPAPGGGGGGGGGGCEPSFNITGGTISTTSRPGYVVHTFTSSGTFTVL